ncbi:MAG: glycosyltransferase family 4 protein [Parcubacteria group bacterium]
MEITIITQLYWPEKSAPSRRLRRMASHLSLHHKVTVFTAFPNYPTGKVFPGYKLRWLTKEIHEGVQVVRSWIIPAPNAGVFPRLASYVSFFFSGVINVVRSIPKSDIVIASSPQLLVGLLGVVAAWRRRAFLILEVRDIWPDSISVMGLITSPVVLFPLRRLEAFLYKRADRIVVVTEGMRDQIVQKGVSREKVYILPNSVDTDVFYPVANTSPLGSQRGRYIACFAGNHSKAQNIFDVVRAAEFSEKNGYPITFVFIGEGEEKSRMQEYAATHKLSNTVFLPQQNTERLREYLSAADVCITSILPSPLFYSALPTKTLEYLACGRPVIFYGRNMFGRKLTTEGIGLSIETSDFRDIPKAVLNICDDAVAKDTMGNRARHFVERQYSVGNFVERVDALIKGIPSHG